MKPLYVINDLHISAIRNAGTTPTTAYQLRQELLAGFKALLDRCDSDVLVNGDFADSYKMIPADMLDCYKILTEWLSRGHRFYAVPGNHCLSKSSLDLSSFEFLFRLLEEQYPVQVRLMMKPEKVRDGIYALGHVTNQDILNLEMEKVPEGTDYLLLHANYNNHFAVQSDHSLNVSKEQALESKAKLLIFGHEHQQREGLGGKVIVVGNQMPSSVADCLGNTTKRMLKITDAGIESIETWKAEGDFVELDWRELADTGARFIRVTGDASCGEAAQVVTAIAKFRGSSKALVITNAVVIEGQDNTEEINLTHEQITNFNVMDALLELLTPEEGTKITTLLENRK
jgi:hypothetical protein